MKVRYIIAAIAIAFSASGASAFGLSVSFGPEDIEKGSHCEVNKVVLLAKDEASCKSAGGTVVKKEAAQEAPKSAEPKAKH